MVSERQRLRNWLYSVSSSAQLLMMFCTRPCILRHLFQQGLRDGMGFMRLSPFWAQRMVAKNPAKSTLMSSLAWKGSPERVLDTLQSWHANGRTLWTVSSWILWRMDRQTHLKFQSNMMRERSEGIIYKIFHLVARNLSRISKKKKKTHFGRKTFCIFYFFRYSWCKQVFKGSELFRFFLFHNRK